VGGNLLITKQIPSLHSNHFDYITQTFPSLQT